MHETYTHPEANFSISVKLRTNLNFQLYLKIVRRPQYYSILILKVIYFYLSPKILETKVDIVKFLLSRRKRKKWQ